MADQVPDHVRKTIQDACAEVDRLSAALATTKAGVNTLCTMFHLPPVYTEIAAPERANLLGGRSDRYFGKAFASVVRTILTARHGSGAGPASVDEIFAEMIDGGFDFEGKDSDNSKRSLAISLSKNSSTFFKLKNGEWGLTEWYPNVKQSKGKAKAPAASAEDDPSNEDFDFEAKEAAAMAEKSA